MPAAYRIARLADVEPADHDMPIDSAWRPVRHHLGVEAFGINAYTGAAAGDLVIEDHDESDQRHQELYFVAAGGARFTVGDDELDAEAGTFVFYADPELRRKAVATEPDTTIVAIGAAAGQVFSPSEWETRRTAGLPRAP